MLFVEKQSNMIKMTLIVLYFYHIVLLTVFKNRCLFVFHIEHLLMIIISAHSQQRLFHDPITKTRLYRSDPLKPHFYTVN